MEIKCDIRRFRGKMHGKAPGKGLFFPQNMQQNKGGPMSCRPCIAGEHRSVRPGCPYVELCYIEPPARRSLYHRKAASPCETTKKIAKNSALCINYSTLFPFCTPPTFRRLSPFFAGGSMFAVRRLTAAGKHADVSPAQNHIFAVEISKEVCYNTIMIVNWSGIPICEVRCPP